jgi:hypothetical protein
MATKLVGTNYTYAERLALYEQAQAECSVAKTMVFRGKTVERPSPEECIRMIDWLENKMRQSDRTSGAMVGYSSHGRC